MSQSSESGIAEMQEQELEHARTSNASVSLIVNKFESIINCPRRRANEMKRSRSEHDLSRIRHVALIAHNGMKDYLIKFVRENANYFKTVPTVITHSTGTVLEKNLGIRIAVKVAGGPLGGDQEIGALIAKCKVAAAIFFRDPLNAHQHAADIEAFW